jgi:hypothetical protein
MLQVAEQLPMLTASQLPPNYVFDEWESLDDTWFKHQGTIFNIEEFSPGRTIPGPKGGEALLATNQQITVAIYEGRIFDVQSV